MKIVSDEKFNEALKSMTDAQPNGVVAYAFVVITKEGVASTFGGHDRSMVTKAIRLLSAQAVVEYLPLAISDQIEVGDMKDQLLGLLREADSELPSPAELNSVQ